MYIFKGPYLKHKDFCPDPVPKFGIPDYANSIRNPKVWGTKGWQDWWEEQFDRCINGYYTGGMFIPGNYYKFLNFDLVSTVGKGNHSPGFIDFQYDFFMLVDHVKEIFKGIIALKARRKGLSEMVCSIMDTGYRFRDAYHAGICAGLSDHVDDFMLKFRRTINLKPDEMKISTLTDNNDMIVAGYRQKDSNGKRVEKGSFNTVFYGTMNKNPNIFKGKYLDDCVFEESGEFELLERGYQASKPCFMDGDMMVGTPYLYGTGGNMNKGSKAFAEIWAEAESMQLEKFFVKASKMYFPCVSYYVNARGQLMEDVPNLKKKYKDHERIGMEDEERAEERLSKERAELKKKKNKKSYHDHIQNYPLTEKESFLKFSGNNFNAEVLNDQLFELNSGPRQYGLFELEYVKDDKGKYKQPLEVEAIPIDPTKTELDDKNYVMIHHNGHPLPQYKDLDVAGIDSYDMDQSNTSSSLGAMVVYRRNNDFSGVLRCTPVALINFRPTRKEVFYEMCLKTAIYYRLLNNVLVDAEKPLVIEHFIANGGSRYLANRPLEFDSPNSEQMHKYGAKFTTYSKPRVLGLLQGDVLDYAHTWVFPPLINDVLDYDVSQKFSDWDSADAYMLARMRDIDMASTNRPKDTQKKEKVDPYQMPIWGEDSSGNMVNVSDSSVNANTDDIKDPFLRLVMQGYYG